MYKRSYFCLAAIVFATGRCPGADVYSLIRDGQLDQARESLSVAAYSTQRDGNRLFFESLIESDAGRSAQLLEAALEASVARTHLAEIHFRLAHYHLLHGDMTKATRYVKDYLLLPDNERHRAEMQRLSIMLEETAQAYEAALLQADRYLLEHDSGNDHQWGLIDKARIMLALNKGIGAEKVLRKLSREGSGPGVPPAFYLLTEAAATAGRTDDALFYFNVLREAYSAAIGVDVLTDRLSDLPSRDLDAPDADKRTGTFYSVQVGVFSKEENAERLGQRIAGDDRPVDIEIKVISGTKYQVVYVGRLKTYDDALKLKQQLEAEHNEVFQVVAR
ncbi:MAG TPA: SPOR domain-containing protein [Candidatus Deferrimicrobium sp.]|nr:SPOR domain-containing protein [Candidatus Deferrimicrobium sp.]